MESWTAGQVVLASISVLGLVIALLARKDSRISAGAAARSAQAAEQGNMEAERSAAAAERSADSAERSAIAAEKGTEQAKVEAWERKVETLAAHLLPGGRHFHQEKTGALVRQLASTLTEQQKLFIEASVRVGHSDPNNLQERLSLLGVASEQLEE